MACHHLHGTNVFRLRGTRRPPPRPPRSTTLERSLPRSVVDARAGPPAVDQVNASADVEPDQPDDACSIPSQLLTVEMLRRPLESTLTALVRVVDHTGCPPLPQRHVERVQHELRAQVVRHRPADDSSTPRIDHDRQVQESGPRRHVRDVRHPELVGTRCSEVALDEVRGRTRVAIPPRRPRSPSTRDPLDPGPAHEPRDPLATDRYAIGGELGMDPRNPVGPSRALMDLHDPVLQRLVRAGSRGRLPLAPRVVAAGGDPQRAAHAFHGELGPVVAHELERPRGVDPVS